VETIAGEAQGGVVRGQEAEEGVNDRKSVKCLCEERLHFAMGWLHHVYFGVSVCVLVSEWVGVNVSERVSE
jgi:hypothetical protein